MIRVCLVVNLPVLISWFPNIWQQITVKRLNLPVILNTVALEVIYIITTCFFVSDKDINVQNIIYRLIYFVKYTLH